MSNEKQTSDNQQGHAPLAGVIPSAVRLGDKMRHKADNCPFIVTGILEDKVQLKGDWSGGTWPVNARSWVSWDDVEHWV